MPLTRYKLNVWELRQYSPPQPSTVHASLRVPSSGKSTQQAAASDTGYHLEYGESPPVSGATREATLVREAKSERPRGRR